MAGKDGNSTEVANESHLSSDEVAAAGYSVLESLMLSLIGNAVLERREVIGLLTDAANAHRGKAASGPDGEFHLRVAGLIETLRDGSNTATPGAGRIQAKTGRR